jgi:hypothetical protein
MAKKFNPLIKYGFDYYEPQPETLMTKAEKLFIAAMAGQTDTDGQTEIEIDFKNSPLTFDYKQ